MSHLKLIFKIVFSFAVLGLLFHEIHLKQLLPYFKHIKFEYLLLGIFSVCIGTFLGGIRWSLIMKTLKAPVYFSFYIKAFFKGIMFNQILPSSVGGDGYRMYEATKLGISKKLAITSVISDRAIGFSGLVLIAFAMLPFSYFILPHHVFYLTFFLSSFALIAIFAVAYFQHIPFQFLKKYLAWCYDLSSTLTSSFNGTVDLCRKLMLGIGTNLLNVICFYFIAKSLHIICSLENFLIIIPIITIITMIPISLAGWGVREGSMVVLGASVGINHPASLAISLMYGLTLIINSLPGFYLYFISKQNPIETAYQKQNLQT